MKEYTNTLASDLSHDALGASWLRSNTLLTQIYMYMRKFFCCDVRFFILLVHLVLVRDLVVILMVLPLVLVLRMGFLPAVLLQESR